MGRNRSIVVVAVLLALAASAAAQQVQPGWIADARTGCQAWNPSPQPNETIAWSGACVGGKASGRGVLQVYWSGKLQGTLDGAFVGGHLEGRGTFNWHQSSRSEGFRYEGEFRNNEPHGRGVLVSANGDRYDGEFRDGKTNGRGVYVWANGSRYDGEWRDSKLHGRGVWTSGDGASRYDGAWSDDKPNGYGVGTYNGVDYAGTWSNGCFRQGSRTWALFATNAECGF